MYYKAVAYIDHEEYKKLRAALALDDMTFSQWVRETAQAYVQSRFGGAMRLVEPKGE